MFNNKSILITGGTGSFGKQMIKTIVKRYKPKKVAVFSRDELKQFEMAHDFSKDEYPFLRYFIGDVRDEKRLEEAFHGMDIIIHSAALKQVPTAEYNPFEAIKTNIFGAQNIIRAAIRQNVKRVIALSTDKAANPINLYGATKLCSDKLFIAANAMSGDADTRFAVVRYGNVVGSRGSVLPFFIEKAKNGILPITDTRMTRFMIELQHAVDFVLDCLEHAVGGEIFVPKIPSCRITDIAKAVSPAAKTEIVGIRPGEKLHEELITKEDAPLTIEYNKYFLIQPRFNWWNDERQSDIKEGKPCPDNFAYNSENNTEWLSVEDLSKMVETFCIEHGITIQ